MQTSPNYRAVLRRACFIAVWRIAVWRIAPLTIAHGAHDLRRALDVNANGTCMHNRVIVHARVCIICTCGCAWCGRLDADYEAHRRLQLVLSRMSLLWRAVQVDVIIEFRVQGAGCRREAS